MQYLLKSVSIALQNMRANPLHTVLSTLGIIIGVAALVGILSLGDGLEQTVREQVAGTTSINLMTVTPKQSEMVDNVRIERDTVFRFTNVHAKELQIKFKGKAYVELIGRMSAMIQYQDSSYAMNIQGTLHHIGNFLAEEDTLTGNFFSQNDIEQHARVAVLSKAAVQKMNSSPQDIIGEKVFIREEPFRVTGVLSGPSGKELKMIVPITTLRDLKNEDLQPSLIMKAIMVEDLTEIKKQTQNWLDERFSEGRDAFNVSTNEMRVEQVREGIFIFKMVMGAITGISVLVGGIGIMNVLLISVTERTREIGIRKAAGAKKRDIVFQFLSESITVSMVGCVLGAIVGYLGTIGIVAVINANTRATFNTALSVDTVIVVIGVALFVGIVFGTYPAWRASQLTPVDAIRHE